MTLENGDEKTKFAFYGRTRYGGNGLSCHNETDFDYVT